MDSLSKQDSKQPLIFVSPRILTPKEHQVPLSAIHKNALKVLNRLNEGGFRACLVGGGVRDLMLGREPKDFDVATDASPEDVKSLFRNCRLIGRRFRLAHIHFGRDIIEVATFRAPHDEAEHDSHAITEENGRIVRDNVFGTLEQDVWRRDFTINALYYDIADSTVIDFTDGVEDLRAGVLKMIGDPEQRFREDPVRMLRAVRLAAKLGFIIDPASEKVMHDLHYLLDESAPARLFDEFLKMMHAGSAEISFERLRHFNLLQHMFPSTEAILNEEGGEWYGQFIVQALANTDSRVRRELPVTPAFLVAVLLWEPMQKLQQEIIEKEGLPPVGAMHLASQQVFSRQSAHVSVPRRFSTMAKEIWELQRRLHNIRGNRPAKLVGHKRFRAAYDFLCLRAGAGDDAELKKLCKWWTEYQEGDEGSKAKMSTGPKGTGSRRPRKRKPRTSD